MSQLPIYTGGLWRCCISLIRNYAGPSPEGHEITCPDCGEPLRVRHGAWELAQPILPATAVNNVRLDGTVA